MEEKENIKKEEGKHLPMYTNVDDCDKLLLKKISIML
jgi:hypothetical protein